MGVETGCQTSLLADLKYLRKMWSVGERSCHLHLVSPASVMLSHRNSNSHLGTLKWETRDEVVVGAELP